MRSVLEILEHEDCWEEPALKAFAARDRVDVRRHGPLALRFDTGLDVKNGSRDRGTELIVWSASSPVSANQRFTLRES